ncbi:hypothetical protein pipiens_005647 [Culex pipiens pipiens]|uniref:Uncharacterized protein n=1 Tax=Culex pipiens pipiens TaxID=38569 RepID=A0ABD1DUV8_CULPP
MVTTRNDSIELTASTAPPPPEERYLNGSKTSVKSSRSKRSRKRCCTLVVLLLVAIGAGTMLLYEYLQGWHPAEGNGGLQPEVARSSFRLPGIGGRDPKMIDSNKEVSSSSTTEVIIASSTKGVIFIDSTTEGKPRINGSTEEDEDYARSDEDDTERKGSGDGRGDDEVGAMSAKRNQKWVKHYNYQASCGRDYRELLDQLVERS